MNIYQWLCLLGIPSMITALFSFILVQIKQNRAIKLGLQAILRDRLLQAYKFYGDQGYADYDAKSNVQNLYAQYEVLGKNGIMSRKHDHFLDLPEAPADETIRSEGGNVA